jgi:hypothetical protein
MKSDADKEALFKQYRAWETEQNAKAQAQIRPEKPEKKDH